MTSLNQLYEEFVASYQFGPVLVLDVNALDYANKPTDFKYVVDQIDAQLKI